MALTTDEKQRLVEYIQQRTCNEFRRGEPCQGRTSGEPTDLPEPHPGCAYAAEMIALVQKA